MRISDWSSDVCSSDLAGIDPLHAPVMLDARLPARGMHEALASILVGAAVLVMAWGTISTRPLHGAWQAQLHRGDSATRSEERRVGKECVSTCRSRGSTFH